MSYFVKSFNKKTGVTYIYEATSYWDKDTKMPRSHRHLVGKLDPVSGEVIPTGKRGRRKTERQEPADSQATDKSEIPDPDAVKRELQLTRTRLEAKTAKCDSLEAEVRGLRYQVKQFSEKLKKLESVLADLTAICAAADQ